MGNLCNWRNLQSYKSSTMHGTVTFIILWIGSLKLHFVRKLDIFNLFLLFCPPLQLYTIVDLNVLLLSESFLILYIKSAPSINNIFRKVTMSSNSTYFIAVFEFLDKGITIVYGSLLSFCEGSDRSGCLRFPNTYVHIFWAREDVMGVHSVKDRWNDLHSFAVIDFFASTLIVVENSYGSIKAACHKLSSCRSIIQIVNGRNVIFMDYFRFLHLSHIEAVTITVVTAGCEVYRFDRVPADAGTFVCHLDLLDRCLSSNIVQNYWSVHACSNNYIYLGWIIPGLNDAGFTPRELHNRFCSFVRPDLNTLSCR